MALIDKETICKEIERRFWDYGTPLHDEDVTKKVDEILDFLDTLPEQPVEGLEEEVKNYFQGHWPGMETVEQCNTDMHFTPPAIMRLAEHFYELGCRRTTVMYDDIEYERQRAEEAELSGGFGGRD